MEGKISVLLADGQALFRKGLRGMLEAEGMSVIGEAGDGEDAREQCRELSPQVVVMETTLPKLNGIEATRKLVEDDPEVKVVAYSSDVAKETVEEMLKAGASAYVLKNSAPVELIEAIRKVHGGEMFLSPSISGVVLSSYTRLLNERAQGAAPKPPSGPDRGDSLAMPVLTTKLHAPGLPSELLSRGHLVKRLKKGRDVPLVLVSAPAGFGKSTLVAHWLAAHKDPVAWVSLDEYDRELSTFMRYLVTAVEACFPKACNGTDALLKVSQPASPKEFATSFSNELEALDKPLVLVLDDYHLVDGRDTHEFMGELLAHPQEMFQLVVITRRDPPLPLARLRANDLVLEIRATDLQLSPAESGKMLSKSLGRTLDPILSARLHEMTEGWFVGLHLIALAARHQEDPERFLEGLHGNIRGVQDYLIEEVLERQPEDLQFCLLETSVATRLNASFCKEVCGRSRECADCGAQMISRLGQAGLPLVALDREGEWYRCHPVFREMLLEQLKRRRTDSELSQLHGRASRWLAAEGVADEAMEHALAAGEPEFAAELLVELRHDLINRGEWNLLARLLDALPPECVESNPALLLARIWVHDQSLRQEEALTLAERVEGMVKGKSAKSIALRAEIDAFRCNVAFTKQDCETALAHASAALKTLPGEVHAIRAQVLQFQVFALQMSGRSEEAITVVFRTLKEDPFPDASFHTLLLHALASIHWTSGDFEGLRQASSRCLEISEQYRQAEMMLGSHYFLGMYHYFRNELEEADRHLMAGLDDRIQVRLMFFARAAFPLALCRLAHGRIGEARQLIEEISRRAMQAGNQGLVERCNGFETEIALREDRLPAALGWAKKNAPGPLPASLGRLGLGPHLTWARVIVSEGRPEGLQRAATHFNQLEELVRTRHNRLQLIQVLNQHALLRDALGEEEIAIAKLGESLELTEAASCFRLMLDDGPPMAELLQRLSGKLPAPDLVRRILEASGVERQAVVAAASPAQPLIEPLTNRELDVLELIGKRLYDKEIADQLSISPGTVKSHLKHLYQKLNVGNRREAVDKARALGML